MLSQDSFYRNLTAEDLRDVKSTRAAVAAAARTRARRRRRRCCNAPAKLPTRLQPPPDLPLPGYNFDAPEAFDKEAIVKCLQELKVAVGLASLAGKCGQPAGCRWLAHPMHRLACAPRAAPAGGDAGGRCARLRLHHAPAQH